MPLKKLDLQDIYTSAHDFTAVSVKPRSRFLQLSDSILNFTFTIM